MKKSAPVASRREFLGVAAAAAAFPYVISSAALGADGRPAPSGRVAIAAIGLGNRGNEDLGAFLPRSDTHYVAVADVKQQARDKFLARISQHDKNQDCKGYKDYRELLARPDIDAVHIATPDHWHAIITIDACRAGKDVFCEKPETRTLREGPLMVAAARRYGRIVSGGSQRVMEDYRKQLTAAWGGASGTLKQINVSEDRVSIACNLAGQAVPDGLDWDMWLGPAPWGPYHPYRCSGSYDINLNRPTSWRCFSDYSGGGMTDWGAHHFGGATFVGDVLDLEPTEIVYHGEGARPWVAFKYSTGLTITSNQPGMQNMQLVFEGEKKAAKTIPTYKGKGSIQGDFLECVRTREKPFRDIEVASHCMVVCHTAGICYQLKRSLKWDQATQQFVGDDEANRWVDRARREPWLL